MRLSTEDESQNKVLYEGSVTAFVVSGLEEYVMYTFTVVSVNVKYSWTSTPVVAMETTHPAGIYQWSINWSWNGSWTEIFVKLSLCEVNYM